MPDTEASVLARIEVRLSSIDSHLSKINGRLDAVERLSVLSDKSIAVLVAESRMSEHEQDNINKRVEISQMRLDDRMYAFIKENGVGLGTLGGLLYHIWQSGGFG